ncbi:MAG: hypothetical protein ABWX63_07330 [Paeniglutamicibacter terrestris]|uniref:Uncharacterized protein n=1 Tax=Paeniglutamicibacter terrestris TaxID=2723403 RepID=A0ABX1GAN2_9MICC|nr:hypothetical protein [Paeniglutamicibacter terrestris]ASN38982.1 hypothetical protein CGQ24_08125 [Arthrobacter sp. 7749]NKG22427.1 hypothetical protein [Paeniglutamicibacter terrestris]
MSILRTYRRDEDGTLKFREAWFSTYEGEELGQFVINHGTVGHVSSTETAKDVTDATAESLLAAFAEQCQEDGFVAITDEQQGWVFVQYALKTATGTDRDKYLQTTAKEALTGHLAWRGLGTVESTDFATRKLNIRILSPEPKKAVGAIKTCLREAKLDFTKLSIATAPYEAPESAKQAFPLPAKGTFSLV